MSEDKSSKTEKASKKKKEKARQEGQVAKSSEVNSAVSVAVLLIFLQGAWESISRTAAKIMSKNLAPERIVGLSEEFTTASLMQVYTNALLDIFRLLWPILLISVLVAILTNVMQTGLLMTTKAISPKFSRINPLEGMKRIFSVKSFVELIKSLLKVGALTYFAYGEYYEAMQRFPNLIHTGVARAAAEFMSIAFRIGVKMSIVFVVIAAADYMYQRWQYEKDLMMTKQEVKEEYKQMEGDPQVKGMIKRKQRQMSRMRMMQNIQDADVVITNPTHYAVAVRYKDKEDKAPVVLAKGEDFLAQKIKEKAREHSVEIVENKPVAQTLYKLCEVGDEIPRDMYKAVAEILAYVYGLKNKTGRGYR